MTEGLKFALYGLHRGAGAEPETIARRARMAEEAGLDGLWVGDHVALPAGVDDRPRLEAVVALTYLAAVTSRIRLGVGLIVLPQRQPVLLAKQLTSLDVLCAGRLTVGVGVGWVEPELAAFGVPLSERAARTEEYLAAMRTLWTGRGAFAGRYVSFPDLQQLPLPAQRPHPPIVVGGHSAAAHRRAVRHGNGWYGWELSVDETAQALDALREVARREPRPEALGELEITITPPGPVDLDTARRYADLGVHRLVLETPDGADAAGSTAIEEQIGTVGDTLVGRA